MVKTPSKHENSQPMPLRHPKIHRLTQKGKNLERSKQKQVQFFDFLKDLHGLERKGRQLSSEDQALMKEIMEQVCRFFNLQKKYGEQKLQRYVMYLANLLNLLGERGKEICLMGDFRNKMRRFMVKVIASEEQGKCKHSKMHGVLYILAILIYREKIHKSITHINQSLYSDKILLKSLLNLTLPKYKRMDKFYGVIIMHLASQNPNKNTSQSIVKNILTNIASIEHEPTLFNMLVLLRSNKNKVSINYQDVLNGRIFDILLQNYPKYIEKYMSYLIIDYLTYLLALFPSLAHKITNGFIANLLTSATPNHLHHPLHQPSIISFTQMALKYSQADSKHTILQQVVDFFITNERMALKMAHILVEHQIDQENMIGLLNSGYFTALLQQINPHNESTQLRKASQTFRKIVIKLSKINKHISEYMIYQLQLRVSVSERNVVEQVL